MEKTRVIPGQPDQGWKLIKTKILLDPAVMLLLDMEDESSLCHTLLDIARVEERNDLDELVHNLSHILHLLIHKPPTNHAKQERDRVNQELLERLQSRAHKKKLTRRSMLKLLVEKQRSIFDRPLEIYVNNTFDPKHVLKVNLDFMPDSFFFHEGMQELRHDIQLAKGMAYRMTSGLHFCPVKESFQFGHHERLTDFLKEIMKKVMIEYGQADPSHFFSWQLGFLWTADGARQQDPHVDYEHKAMLREEQRCVRNNMKQTLPYSMDLPLEKGGMKLNYYGPQEQLYEIPLLVKCAFKECVVWRGDAVHGGGHRDLLGGGGFRCHGYIHMNSGGRAGMSNTVLPKIDWQDSFRKRRYSSYLKLSTGESFPTGNDK